MKSFLKNYLFLLGIFQILICNKLETSSAPTIVVTTQGLMDLQFFDDNVHPIFISNFGTLNTSISTLKSGDKITFDSSTKQFTGSDGTALSGVGLSATSGGTTTLGQFNGDYMAMWKKHDGDLGYATFSDKIYIALAEVGTNTQKIIASGETLSELKVGMALSNGKSVIIPFAATQLSAIQSHFGTGKHGVTITFALGNPSGGNQGMTINVKTSTGDNVTGFPVTLAAGTLKTTDNSTVPTGVTASGKFVQYQTDNMQDSVMIKTDQHQFTFNEDAQITDGQKVSDTTLTQKLEALGASPTQSAVKNAIESHYNNDSATIKSDWSTISGDLSSAGLSSMTSALKAELDKPIPVAKNSGTGAGGRF